MVIGLQGRDVMVRDVRCEMDSDREVGYKDDGRYRMGF